MRNHDEGEKMLSLDNVMLSEVDCVLENAVQVKKMQLNANSCQVLPGWNRVESCFSRGFA